MEFESEEKVDMSLILGEGMPAVVESPASDRKSCGFPLTESRLWGTGSRVSADCQVSSATLARDRHHPPLSFPVLTITLLHNPSKTLRNSRTGSSSFIR
jgi:hypothetical protein